MKSFRAKYFFPMTENPLRLLSDIAKMKERSHISKMNNEDALLVTVQFKATDKMEAMQMAAINTGRSIVAFKTTCEQANYSIELIEQTWIGGKVISDQFFSYRKRSA